MKKIVTILLVLVIAAGCVLYFSGINLNGFFKQGADQDTPVNVSQLETPNQDMKNDPAYIAGMAEDIIKNMTLEEKVGQLFVVNLEQLDTSKGSYYNFRKITSNMKEAMNQYHIGGVTFFSRNMENTAQTKKLIQALQASSRIPLFVSVDEEGGSVSRIASNKNMNTTQFPTMEEIGKNKDEDYVYDMGCTIAKEIKDIGFNVDFAPVVDVKTNDANTEIGDRSFGSDAELVARLSAQVVKGIQSQDVSATLKHFPGHGNTDKDSHDGPVNLENDLLRLRSVDFLPFKEGIKAGADFIMVSHISIDKVAESFLPSSLNSLVMNEMIREELGFKGIIITDAMDMKAITSTYSASEAAVLAVKAGVDLVLMPANLDEAYHAVLNAVKTDEIKEEQVNESLRKILETKIKRGIISLDTDLVK